ncbi:MAG: hypothetical protein ABR567_10120 [Myxococcales bacterium]
MKRVAVLLLLGACVRQSLDARCGALAAPRTAELDARLSGRQQ